MTKRREKLQTECADLDDEIDFQHRSWAFQSWGRALVLGFVILAALGLFGGGVMGDETVGDERGGLQVTHPRFARHDSAYEVRIEIQPNHIKEGRVAVWIDQALLEGLTVEGVMPEPESVEKSGEGVVFNLKSDANGPLIVDGYLRTRGFGGATGRVGIVGGPSVQLKHFIYP